MEVCANDLITQTQIKCKIPVAMRGDLELRCGLDFEKYKYLSNIQANIGKFVEQGCNLYIYSKYTGNGKTSWAVKLLNQYIRNVYTEKDSLIGLFVNVDDFLVTQIKPLHLNQSFIATCKNVDLLILDDIGCSKLTSIEEQILRDIINTRLLNKKSTIYTSNRIDDGLCDTVGLNLGSKIIDSSVIVELTNNSQRKPIDMI